MMSSPKIRPRGRLRAAVYRQDRYAAWRATLRASFSARRRSALLPPAAGDVLTRMPSSTRVSDSFRSIRGWSPRAIRAATAAAACSCCAAFKIFQGTPEGGPVIVPHQEHLPPDVGAAKLWLSRRQPDLWRERRQVDVSGSLEHRLNQMTPEERAADAVELMERVKRRLAEYQQTIEHEPSPEPETDD